ncbi:MAG TPA: hypothetical protein VEO53_17935, partial [Candidatus Binatia bacterium]|nr:hypothetical protein [Candidatus Binatia bacterium]
MGKVEPYRAALQRSRLDQLIEQLSPSVPSEYQIAARSELRQFGSNAIPFLISNIQCELRTPWAVYQRHKLELKQRFGRASSDD